MFEHLIRLSLRFRSLTLACAVFDCIGLDAGRKHPAPVFAPEYLNLTPLEPADEQYRLRRSRGTRVTRRQNPGMGGSMPA